jgi:translocation and assembly module TamB
LIWGTGLRLDGRLRFFDVDVPTLLRSAGEASKIANGRMSGRLDFGGENVHSIDDLTATLDATFSQTQALQLPVLDVLARNVAPGQSAMTFQTGDVQARLARGVVHVKRLSMSNATLQMLIEGTVTLSGRLDLEATASTGTLGINPNALRLLGVRLPPVGPIPLGTIVQASAYLSNRVVHLRVTGTVKNPSVQIDPLPLLTEEAIRFFLGAAVGVPMP